MNDDVRVVTPTFLLITAATFAFFISAGINIPLVPLFIEHRLHGGNLAIGVAVTLFSLAAILARPALGRFGERRGLRRMMVVGASITAVACAGCAFANSLWVLLPFRCLQGIGEAALYIGGASQIYRMVPPRRRAEATSYWSVSLFGGMAVGPIISQAVVGSHRYAAGFLVAAGFALLAVILCRLTPRGDIEQAGSHAGPQPRFHRAAMLPGAVLALAMAGLATFYAFVPAHAEDIGLSSAALVFTVNALITLVLRVLGARIPERIGLPAAVSTALVALAAGLAAIAAFSSAFGLYFGAVLVAIGATLMFPSLVAVAVNSAPDSESVRVVATFTMFVEVGSAVGGIVFGALAQATSRRGGFFGGSVASLISLVMLWLVLIPRLRAREVRAASTA